MRFEIICGVLIVILLILIWKIVVMRRAVKEIREGITQKLETETNTLLTIDSRNQADARTGGCDQCGSAPSAGTETEV